MTTPAGHRVLPHTASTAIEAWVPDKAACIAEAVQAMVGSFTDVRDAILAESVTLRFDVPDDRDLLVEVLNEVISQQKAHNRIPADTSVTEITTAARSRAEVRFAAAPADQARAAGAVPTGISQHGLRFGPSGDGQWHCHVIIDT